MSNCHFTILTSFKAVVKIKTNLSQLEKSRNSPQSFSKISSFLKDQNTLAQFMCFFSISGFSISAFQDNFFYDFEAIIILHMTLTFVTYFIKKWNVKNVSTYVNNYHFLHFISILNYFLTKMSNSDETIFILSKFAFCSFLNFEKILKIENFMTIFIFMFNFRQFESKNYR